MDKGPVTKLQIDFYVHNFHSIYKALLYLKLNSGHKKPWAASMGIGVVVINYMGQPDAVARWLPSAPATRHPCHTGHGCIHDDHMIIVYGQSLYRGLSKTVGLIY